MKRVSNILLAAGLALIPLSSAYAGGWAPPSNQPAGAPTELEPVILTATNWLLGMAGVIAVVAIIYGGIQYLTSAGNQDQARDAKSTIKYAVMGLVIAGIAYAIVNVIITTVINGGGTGGAATGGAM